jgi:hypothetical protein
MTVRAADLSMSASFSAREKPSRQERDVKDGCAYMLEGATIEGNTAGIGLATLRLRLNRRDGGAVHELRYFSPM